VKAETKQVSRKKVLLYIALSLLLLLSQKATNMAGKYVADMFSYEKLDPYNAYARNFMYHITMMLIGLFAILILRRLLKVSFGLDLGDRKTGTRFVVMYTAIIAGISLIVHILMKTSNSLPVYAFPLNKNNIIWNALLSIVLNRTVRRASVSGAAHYNPGVLCWQKRKV